MAGTDEGDIKLSFIGGKRTSDILPGWTVKENENFQ